VSRKKTISDFIAEAIAIHGDRYDYSNAKYIGVKNPIEIKCKDHGSFFQRIHVHLNGHGCPLCGSNRNSVDRFLDRANKIHKMKYDYSKVLYKNLTTPVTIICQIHGDFDQCPRDHLQGCGCPKCAGRKNTEEFVQQAHRIHGAYYDYSSTTYTAAKHNVTILCPRHGTFTQKAYAHLRGQGCPSCSKCSSKAEQAWLDHHGIPEEYRQYPIRLPEFKRPLVVDGFDPSTNTVYEFYGDFWHGNPAFFDQSKPHRVASSRRGTYGDVYNRTLKRQTILENNGYNVKWIWESEWLQTSNQR
jgi:hypothetical protein